MVGDIDSCPVTCQRPHMAQRKKKPLHRSGGARPDESPTTDQKPAKSMPKKKAPRNARRGGPGGEDPSIPPSRGSVYLLMTGDELSRDGRPYQWTHGPFEAPDLTWRQRVLRNPHVVAAEWVNARGSGRLSPTAKVKATAKAKNAEKGALRPSRSSGAIHVEAAKTASASATPPPETSTTRALSRGARGGDRGRARPEGALQLELLTDGWHDRPAIPLPPATCRYCDRRPMPIPVRSAGGWVCVWHVAGPGARLPADVRRRRR